MTKKKQDKTNKQDIVRDFLQKYIQAFNLRQFQGVFGEIDKDLDWPYATWRDKVVVDGGRGFNTQPKGDGGDRRKQMKKALRKLGIKKRKKISLQELLDMKIIKFKGFLKLTNFDKKERDGIYFRINDDRYRSKGRDPMSTHNTLTKDEIEKEFGRIISKWAEELKNGVDTEENPFEGDNGQ